MMDAEEQIWTLTRGEPRSVYSLEAVTVRAEDINDATEQRPSITSPSSVPSLFPLYRKYRLRLGKPLSFVLVFYNALATRFLNRASSFYALIVLLHSRSRVEFWWTTVDTHYAKVVIDNKEEKEVEKKEKGGRKKEYLSVEQGNRRWNWGERVILAKFNRSHWDEINYIARLFRQKKRKAMVNLRQMCLIKNVWSNVFDIFVLLFR